MQEAFSDFVEAANNLIQDLFNKEFGLSADSEIFKCEYFDDEDLAIWNEARALLTVDEQHSLNYGEISAMATKLRTYLQEYLGELKLVHVYSAINKQHTHSYTVTIQDSHPEPTPRPGYTLTKQSQAELFDYELKNSLPKA